LLLLPAQSYRAEAFVSAAERLCVDLLLATDLPAAFARYGCPTVSVDLRDPPAAASVIVRQAQSSPLSGVLATNESTALVAALCAEALGLPHAAAHAAEAARNKRRMRQLFASAGVPSPRFVVLDPQAPPAAVLPDVRFPCVVKPSMLTGSQGVIRADTPQELIRAVHRVRGILAHHSSDASADPDFHRLLVEDYLPGREVAVEALITRGELVPLAIFDKPDDLTGPFFEETLYVTPSRLPAEDQAAIVEVTARAAKALGLTHGPIHAELRIAGGRPAVVEVAARSIGGLCSRVFEFVAGPLEDLLIAHAAGLPLPRRAVDAKAAGVMMMPIPRSGVLREVRGIEDAERVPGIESVTLSIRPGQAIRALPEGGSYLGFIFARGEDPGAVEQSLRDAFAALEFKMAPLLDITPD
jgi:biotin carboxylase